MNTYCESFIFLKSLQALGFLSLEYHIFNIKNPPPGKESTFFFIYSTIWGDCVFIF